jgi:hypothetical protein
MAVLLSGLKIARARVRMLDFGGELTPGLGGMVQRINRMGSRYALDVELPPLPEEPDGRLLTTKLRQAKQEGALFPFPQPSLHIGSPGAPVVDGTGIAGTTLPLRGLTPHYAIRAGQFMSVITAGRRYLYAAAAQAIADASGSVTVTIAPMLRAEPTDGDIVEIGKPMIEGWLGAGDLEHEMMLEPYFGIRFSITEAE